MKCKCKEVVVNGLEFYTREQKVRPQPFICICSNDEKGKTLSIDNGFVQFSIPFEPIEKYFKGDYKK